MIKFTNTSVNYLEPRECVCVSEDRVLQVKARNLSQEILDQILSLLGKTSIELATRVAAKLGVTAEMSCKKEKAWSTWGLDLNHKSKYNKLKQKKKKNPYKNKM